MPTLQQWKNTWDALAESDALYTVCSDPRREGKRWTPDELLATGAAEIKTIVDHLHSLGLEPGGNGRALDFGCGVGRLTQALSAYFSECCGIDISSGMIATAQQLAKDNPRCRFFVNGVSDLSRFESGTFSFVYSSIVLQHIEPVYAEKYLAEFARVLEPGGILVFQIPDRRKGQYIQRVKEHLRIRTRLKSLLSRLGMPEGPQRSGWKMYEFSESRIRDIFASASCSIADVQLTNSCQSDFNGDLRFLSAEPAEGFVSKLYVVARNKMPERAAAQIAR